MGLWAVKVQEDAEGPRGSCNATYNCQHVTLQKELSYDGSATCLEILIAQTYAH